MDHLNIPEGATPEEKVEEPAEEETEEPAAEEPAAEPAAEEVEPPAPADKASDGVKEYGLPQVEDGRTAVETIEDPDGYLAIAKEKGLDLNKNSLNGMKVYKRTYDDGSYDYYLKSEYGVERSEDFSSAAPAAPSAEIPQTDEVGDNPGEILEPVGAGENIGLPKPINGLGTPTVEDATQEYIDMNQDVGMSEASLAGMKVYKRTYDDGTIEYYGVTKEGEAVELVEAYNPNNTDEYGNEWGAQGSGDTPPVDETGVGPAERAVGPVTIQSGDQVKISGSSYYYYGSVRNPDGSTVDYYYAPGGELYYQESNGSLSRAYVTDMAGAGTWNAKAVNTPATVSNVNSKFSATYTGPGGSSTVQYTRNLCKPDGSPITQDKINGKVTFEGGNERIAPTGEHGTGYTDTSLAVVYPAETLESFSNITSSSAGGQMNGYTTQLATQPGDMYTYAKEGTVVRIPDYIKVQYDLGAWQMGEGLSTHDKTDLFFAWSEKDHAWWRVDEYGNRIGTKVYDPAGFNDNAGVWRNR